MCFPSVLLTLTGFQLICLKAVLAPFQMFKLETSAEVYQQTHNYREKTTCFHICIGMSGMKTV